MPTLLKSDLVDEVAKVSNLTKKETELLVNTIFDTIAAALTRGEKVELRGFGSFRIRGRRPRHGRNPKTGSGVEVPAKRVPFFKPGKHVKELIEGEGAPPSPSGLTLRAAAQSAPHA